MNPSKFRSGDNVFFRVVKGAHETLLAATVLRVFDYGDVEIQFAAPNEDGETTDIVNPDDLILASDGENKTPFAPDPPLDSSPSMKTEHPAITQLLCLYPQKSDRVAVTFIHSTKKDAEGRSISKTDVVSVNNLVSERYIARLQARNTDGDNIYFSMNSIQPGANRRKKEFADQPAHVFMEVDYGGDSTLDSVRTLAAAKVIPPPTLIVRSSESKYQFVWNVDPTDFTFEKIELLNAGLCRRFGSDPACTDCLRVFRACGFKNLKYENKPTVEVIEINAGERYKFADFHIEVGELKGDGPVKTAAGEDELEKIVRYVEEAAEKVAAKGTDLNLSPLEKWGDQGYLFKCKCLWVKDHTKQVDSGSVIIIHKSGAISYRCAHTHCLERTWQKDVRPKLEEIVGHSLRFGDPVGGVVIGGDSQTSSATVKAPQQAAIDESPMKVLSEEDYRFPTECLEGDRLCDLTHELTDGTFIPPQFVHSDLQVWTGHCLDGHIVPPNSTYLNFSTRFYLNKFSFHPQTGKGESWERVKWAFTDLLTPRPKEGFIEPNHIYAPLLVDGTGWGSGPFAVSQLVDTPNCICFLDEGSVMWLTKAPTDQKSLENVFLSLFEGNQHSTGSFKNKKYQATNVHLSQTASFTLDSFTESYQGRGSGGSGYLSRVCLSFGSKIPLGGKTWPMLQETNAKKYATEISDRMTNHVLLGITPEARHLISDFKLDLEKEDQHFSPRIGFYFDKDLVLRAAFRDGVVTPDLVRRSIRWAQEQIYLRKRFWPVDSLTEQGRLEFKLLGEFETVHTIRSDRQLQKSIHLGERRCKFSARDYNFAREALLRSGQLERAGYNKTGNALYQRRAA
jgi:hypothetical protein